MTSYEKMKARKAQEAVGRAVKNWYLLKDGFTWTRLTQAEARKAFEAGFILCRATVDEELAKDGI